MKKLVLLAAAALTVVACKKDKNEDNPTPPQPEKPVEVPAGFVKQTIFTQAGVPTETTTYNVENNVLKGWTVTNNYGTVTHSLSYEGKNLKTYNYQDGTRAVNEEYTFIYQDNKLTKITSTSNGQTDTFIVTTDSQGRITSKINTGIGNNFNADTWTVTFQYDTNSLKVVNTKDGTATYTYTYNNGNVTKIETINYQRLEENFEYDTTVVNELNNQYILLANLARLNIRGHQDVKFGTDQDLFVKQSKNIVNKFTPYSYEITKNGNKPTKIVKRDATGAPISTLEYKY